MLRHIRTSAGGRQAKGEVVVVPDSEVPRAAVRVRDHAAHAGDGVLSLREGLVVR